MNKSMVGLWLGITLAAGAAEVAPAAPQRAHPRLLWTAEAEAAVKAKVQQDPRSAELFDAIRITADHMLGEPPVIYQKEGRRLLHRSREALSRIMHLGCAARMTGDQRYVARAVAELKAAAAMPDWNPSHFLDTAEMTLAMALGYDWLYAELAPADRAVIREAIEKKGLGPYLKPGSKHGWERGGNNWNQVCHAGMVAGALALQEDDPDRAAKVVARALAGLPYAMKVYEPDGTYPEGPGYWNYGTTFNVTLIAMLESALGTDFGLSQKPGFLKTGEFPLHMTGATGLPYSFSDSGTRAGFSPAMAWFARRTHRPELLWCEAPLLQREIKNIRDSHGAKQSDRFFPMALLWADVQLQRTEPAALNWYGRGPNPLAVFRTSWTDPNAVYLAIKAGSPGASHGHMDIGSFVMDADGVRWALDLGMQNYHRLEARGFGLWNGKQGGERWKLFRYHNRGHSTLLVDEQEQVVKSQAPIAEFSAAPGKRFAVVDLTATYAGQMAAAKRRFSVEPDHRVVIEDQLTGGAKDSQVRWAMVTPGKLQPGGWLEKDGQRLRLEVLSPAGAQLHSWPAHPPPHDFDEPNPGVSVVGFVTPLAAGQAAVLKVRLTPGSVAK
jgi:hypothetical protein